MKIAMISPVAWRTPPNHYGPWENIVSLLTEGLTEQGVDVTLFATADSQTKARLSSVIPKGYEEDKEMDPKVVEYHHISEVMEQADEFDLIHSHYDFMPLTYSRLISTPMITTIHGFSSPKILPIYEKYNDHVFYVSISHADKSDKLSYIKTIYHGINLKQFTFNPKMGEYLLFFGRFHRDKGAKEAIEIALKTDKKLIMAGIIQDQDYFDTHVKPYLDDDKITYVGSVGPEKRDELLGNAYALLHPINFEEPFGLSVVESMACGTPVIAFNKGSMPELIETGKNGYLVNTVDEAAKSLNQIGNIDRAYCRKIVEQRFSVDDMVDAYIDVYKEILKQRKREDHRPWGYYTILADPEDYKAKKILVYPHKRLSLQKHSRRGEHWFVIEGEGIVTLGEKQIHVSPGQSVDIPVHTVHRIENPTDKNLVFIEIQHGDYFGEDDIVRLEDDYGRT
ncbi:MAG: mannose-6-phosphate isomerase [bacterium]|nr:MAG: mannose-6-phosphate isomerase [bacterium]